jgi:hypothetical protein
MASAGKGSMTTFLFSFCAIAVCHRFTANSEFRIIFARLADQWMLKKI